MQFNFATLRQYLQDLFFNPNNNIKRHAKGLLKEIDKDNKLKDEIDTLLVVKDDKEVLIDIWRRKERLYWTEQAEQAAKDIFNSMIDKYDKDYTERQKDDYFNDYAMEYIEGYFTYYHTAWEYLMVASPEYEGEVFDTTSPVDNQITQLAITTFTNQVRDYYDRIK